MEAEASEGSSHTVVVMSSQPTTFAGGTNDRAARAATPARMCLSEIYLRAAIL